jgi:hypothetical protein
MLPLACTDVYPPDGVVGVPGLIGVPFVLIQSLKVVLIDDGVLSLGQRYPAKSIAVTEPAIAQRQNDERPRQPIGNRNGKIESDNHRPPRFLKDWEKSEPAMSAAANAGVQSERAGFPLSRE